MGQQRKTAAALHCDSYVLQCMQTNPQKLAPNTLIRIDSEEFLRHVRAAYMAGYAAGHAAGAAATHVPSLMESIFGTLSK